MQMIDKLAQIAIPSSDQKACNFGLCTMKKIENRSSVK